MGGRTWSVPDGCSRGARGGVAAAGIGRVDETGAAEIAIDTIVTSGTGRPAAKVDRPARWTPAVVSVAEPSLRNAGDRCVREGGDWAVDWECHQRAPGPERF